MHSDNRIGRFEPPGPPAKTPSPSVPGSSPRARTRPQEESLETRIGQMWLPRVAVLLIMTAVVLLATRDAATGGLSSFQRVGLGAGLAAAAVLAGLWPRTRHTFLARSALGAGLAGLYYASFGVFYLDLLGLPIDPRLALAGQLACLLLMVGIVHWRGSRTAAGIALFLAYYTVLLSAAASRDAAAYTYALTVCAALAAAAVVFHATHRWMSFTWAALLATYGIFAWFFNQRWPSAVFSSQAQFAATLVFLGVCFLAFSTACIIDTRKAGAYRRSVAPLAFVNTVFYAAFMYTTLRRYGAEDAEWLFRLGLAGATAVFAVFAETTGERRNYLAQTFIALTVLFVTLALEALLTRERLLVALGLECLVLALAYRWTGAVMFKVLNLVILAATFAGCLASAQLSGTFDIGNYRLPANWFACGGAATALAATAWYYERHVRHLNPGQRRVSSHWFAADTVLDLHAGTAAMLHAAAAALILVAAAILDRGTDAAVPFYLGAIAAGLGAAGLAARTPQLWVASVLALAAAHVCYYFLDALDAGFAAQPHALSLSLGLAAMSFVGGYFWDRYVQRIEIERTFEHYAVAAIPYAGAAALVCWQLERRFPSWHPGLEEGAAGLAILALGTVLRRPALRLAALVPLAVSTVQYLQNLFRPEAAYAVATTPAIALAAMLTGFLAAERLIYAAFRYHWGAARHEHALRSALVATAGAVGLLGLYFAAPPDYLTLAWTAHGLGGMALGAVLRESRYRWAALLVFALCIARLFAYDFSRLTLPMQVGVSLGLGAALLAISWAYGRARSRGHRAADTTHDPIAPARR